MPGSYYAKNYASIIGLGLLFSGVQKDCFIRVYSHDIIMVPSSLSKCTMLGKYGLGANNISTTSVLLQTTKKFSSIAISLVSLGR